MIFSQNIFFFFKIEFSADGARIEKRKKKSSRCVRNQHAVKCCCQHVVFLYFSFSWQDWKVLVTLLTFSALWKRFWLCKQSSGKIKLMQLFDEPFFSLFPMKIHSKKLFPVNFFLNENCFSFISSWRASFSAPSSSASYH